MVKGKFLLVESEEYDKQRPGIPRYAGSCEEAPSSGALKTKSSSELPHNGLKSIAYTRFNARERKGLHLKDPMQSHTPGPYPEESGKVCLSLRKPCYIGESQQSFRGRKDTRKVCRRV
jgi:hypothetical protein